MNSRRNVLLFGFFVGLVAATGITFLALREIYAAQSFSAFQDAVLAIQYLENEDLNRARSTLIGSAQADLVSAVRFGKPMLMDAETQQSVNKMASVFEKSREKHKDELPAPLQSQEVEQIYRAALQQLRR